MKEREFFCLSVFTPYTSVSKVLVSFSPFQRWIGTCPPTPCKLPLSTIRGLWSSHCLSVLTQRLQSSVISGLHHVQACMVGAGCEGDFLVRGKKEGAYMFSHLPSLAQFTLTRRARTTSSPQKDQPVSWGSRERWNLLRSTGDRKRMSVYHNVNNIQLGSQKQTCSFVFSVCL